MGITGIESARGTPPLVPVHAMDAVDAPAFQALFQSVAQAGLESRAQAPYTVRSGDTLWSICRDRLMTAGGDAPTPRDIHAAVQKVAAANRLANPDFIRAGQTLDLSPLAPASTAVAKHAAPATAPLAALRPAGGPVHPLPQVQAAYAVQRGGRSAAQANASWRALVGAAGELTSVYGVRRDPITGEHSHHDGIDVAAAPGSPIRAWRPGTVTFSGWQDGYGKVVIVDHGSGLETVYAHAARLHVKRGDAVGPGAVLAEVGTTGRSTGPHLHFEVRRHGEAIDPGKVLALDRRL